MILSIVPTNSYAREKSLEQFPLFWRDLPRALSKYLPGEKAIDLETVVVKALPKTRSGKVLRGTMRKIANGEEYTVTPTIEDPNVFTDLSPVILKLVNE